MTGIFNGCKNLHRIGPKSDGRGRTEGQTKENFFLVGRKGGLPTKSKVKTLFKGRPQKMQQQENKMVQFSWYPHSRFIKLFCYSVQLRKGGYQDLQTFTILCISTNRPRTSYYIKTESHLFHGKLEIFLVT